MASHKMSRRAAIAALGTTSVGVCVAPALGGVQMAKNEVKEFGEASKAKLKKLVSDPAFSGRLGLADVKTLAEGERWDVNQVMLSLLPTASGYSRAPISNFHVGALVRGASGDLYFGANLELAGMPLGTAVHAEQSAIANAFMHREEMIGAVAVNYAPCGHCRQFMNELSLSHDIEILVAKEAPTTLSVLLPHSFGPKDLNAKRGALPPQRDNSLKLEKAADVMSGAALEAAQLSYAPHSQSPSGVAIQTKRKKMFKGSYIENAAYNPSLPPLQVALSALVLAGGDFSEIETVLLVEKKGAKISQEKTTQLALSSANPAAKMSVAFIHL